MGAFSPQDQWTKYKSEPILAMSEGLVEATGRLLGLLALLLASVVVTRLLLTSGAVLLAFTTATTSSRSSMASMTSGGDGGKQGRVVLHWLLHGGHQV